MKPPAFTIKAKGRYLSLADIEKRPYWEYIVDPVMRSLPLPSEPRYERSTQLALIFLLTENIDHFPVDPYAFFHKYHIKLKKYSTIAEKTNLENVAEVIRETGSVDGFTVCRQKSVSVSYNDVTPFPRRILFTLLHEIGHIVLGHLFDFQNVQYYRGGTDGVDVLEKEADNFARNVIVPAFMVSEMHITSKSACLEMFGCTGACWDARIGLLNADLANTNPGLIPLLRQQLSPFMYARTCLRCFAGFVGHKGLQYCPICGGKRFKWKKNGFTYPEAYPLNDEGYTSKCPRCMNTEPDSDGFCTLCHTPMINRCINPTCNSIAISGNTRFCTRCGSMTTFMSTGLLSPWYIPEDYMNDDDEVRRDTYYDDEPI